MNQSNAVRFEYQTAIPTGGGASRCRQCRLRPKLQTRDFGYGLKSNNQPNWPLWLSIRTVSPQRRQGSIAIKYQGWRRERSLPSFESYDVPALKLLSRHPTAIRENGCRWANRVIRVTFRLKCLGFQTLADLPATWNAPHWQNAHCVNSLAANFQRQMLCHVDGPTYFVCAIGRTLGRHAAC
jgi:hypothetical protein